MRVDNSKGFEDVFGKFISDSTNNEIDIASHYPYSPEKFRLYSNGTRIFPEYASSINDLSQYNHRGDVHVLSPSSGETVRLETAERAAYVVQYELAMTMAFNINQDLQSGDYVRGGLYDGDDGWFFEFNGDHSGSNCDFVVLRDGDQILRQTEDARVGPQKFARMLLETAWYDIARQKWSRSVATGGHQDNPIVARTTRDTERGPRIGNFPIRMEVKASSSTNGLELRAGSFGLVTYGDTEKKTRLKRKAFEYSINSKDVWVPFQAARIKPDYFPVEGEFQGPQILDYSANASVEVTVQAFDPSNVTFNAGSWFTPDAWLDANNAIEVREDIDQIANNQGNLETNPTNPGGWQVGYAPLFQAGGITRRATEGSDEIKRKIYEKDIVVALAKSSSTGTLSYYPIFEQNW